MKLLSPLNRTLVPVFLLLFAASQYAQNGAIPTIFSSPAFGQFGPTLTNAYTSSPGGITIMWLHGGPGVDFYFADIRLAKSSGPINRSSPISKDLRNHTFLGLTPSTLYEVRICADYNRELECSHADDEPWVAVKTMGPERQPNPSPGPPPAPPVSPPVLTAAATRERDNGPIVVGLRNTALRALPSADRAQIAKQTWWRGERLLAQDWNEVIFDRDPPSWTTYKVCFELISGDRSCSSVRAGYLGSAMSFTNVAFAAHLSHKYLSGYLEESVEREEDQSRSSFLLRPGLVPVAGGISFEIVGMPRHYFVWAAGGLKVVQDDGTEDFRRRGTFQVIVPALGYPGRTDIVNFESVFQRGTYMWANYTAVVVSGPAKFDRPWASVAAFRFQPALVQPSGMQVRDLSRMRVIDTHMPDMVKPPRRLGKRVPSSPPPATTDPCVSYEKAVARGLSPAIVAVLKQKCIESKR